MLTYSLIGAAVISSFSLLGVFSFAFNDKLLKKISILFVAFSSGALLGGAFLHLLPEAVSQSNSLDIYIYLLIGIITFYILERIFKWHHCHNNDECQAHTFTYMSLVGDSVHNFIDGMVIVSAFYISPEVGIATTIAVASHEIPQELGDFGILIHGGFSKVKALACNFMSALLAIAGVLIGYFLIDSVENMALFLLPFAAGGFIYVSLSDLIPELNKEDNMKKSLIYFGFFMFGLVFMYLTKTTFD